MAQRLLEVVATRWLMGLSLDVSAIHPTVNVWSRWHWTRRMREAKAWRESIALAVRSMKPLRGKVKITTIYHFRDSRPRDLGNYEPKFAIDGLTKKRGARGGVLADDNATVVVANEVRFGPPDRTRPHMYIFVEELS